MPFAHERKAISGNDGAAIGWTVTDAKGPRVFLGTNVYSEFNRGGYYSMTDAEVDNLSTLARFLLQPANVHPAVSSSVTRVLAWARRSPGRVYVFVVNDGPLTPATEALEGTPLGTPDRRRLDSRLADEHRGVRDGGGGDRGAIARDHPQTEVLPALEQAAPLGHQLPLDRAGVARRRSALDYFATE